MAEDGVLERTFHHPAGDFPGRQAVFAYVSEVAVHGWDVARACGLDAPVPPALAEELLALCHLLVHDADRPTRFAGRLDWSLDLDNPSDRLVAFLGRRP